MLNVAEVFPGRIRILVVDDDSDLRLTLCEYLESRNFVVSSARNGTEASTILQSGKLFDIIITDLIMSPGPDGLAVLKIAKQLNPLSYVVIMTGYSSIETAIESIRCGAFDYLTKPFKLAEIEIVANRIIEYLALVDENKRLAYKLALATDAASTLDARLERIESLLSRLVTNV